MIITYKSDPDAIRDVLPEPLEPDGSDTVLYELIKMPDSAGFGDYTESGVVIPALFKNEPVNFTAQMYLDMNRRSQEVEKFGASPKNSATRNSRLSTIRLPADCITLTSSWPWGR